MQSQTERLGITPERVICTGDIVAYCGNPEQTVNQIRNWNCHVVLGNCEDSVGNEKNDCGCGFENGSLCETLAVDWYNLAIEEVSSVNKEWMRSQPRGLKFSIDGINLSVVHGGIENLSEFIFESSTDEIKLNHLSTLDSDCIIAGHCGIPFGQKLNDKFWINAGVIGMPANDGQTNGWYLRIDKNNNRVIASWHKLIYDTQETIKAMTDAGLPIEYQQTLASGLWPSMSILPDKEKSQQGKPLDPKSIVIS